MATELAGIGGPELPVEVSAVDSYASVTDAPSAHAHHRARASRWGGQIFLGQEMLCDILERCHAVSMFLLEHSPAWLDEA